MTRFTIFLFALGLFPFAGQSFELNYKPSEQSAATFWGTGKADTYDVAVRLDAPALVGRNITGFSVKLASTGVQNVKGWLSSKLSLKKVSGVNSNNPDILSQDAEVDGDMLTVTFTEPYALAADGVYVGYSFQMASADDAEGKKPVACYEGVNPDGLWVHTRKSVFNWTDMSEQAACISAISVHIEGELEPYAASISQTSETYAAQGDEIRADVLLANHGSQPVTSFTYRYRAGGEETEATCALPEPLPPLYMAATPVTLPLQPAQARGEYQGTVAITQVNGHANPEDGESSFPLYVLGFTPHKTVVMEELTGTWCGWCPRGLACMEHIAADYPDNFLAIAYHQDDEMTTAAGDPVNSSSLPCCMLDRAYKGDPGYPNIAPRFIAMADARPVANISVNAALEDGKVTYTSSVIFAKSIAKAKYRVAYMLLADGLRSPKWIQSNSYSGLQDRAEEDSYLQYFIDSPKAIVDMPYTDVMVYCKDIKGISGSVPAEIAGDTPMEHTHVITLADVVNRVGDPLTQEGATYRVAALLIDSASGQIVNAAKCAVGDTTGIDHTALDSQQSVPQYFDLTGRRVANPANGVYIRVRGGKADKVRL